MNKIARLALAIGTAGLLSSSFAFAAPAADVAESAAPAYIQDGDYGDPNVATFVVADSGSSIELPCSVASFPSKIELPKANGGNFSSVGTFRSSLQAPSSGVPVLMTGKASVVCIVGACPADANDFTVTLTNLDTFAVIGTYTFRANEAGVGVRCG
jgi:hypothetical protein